MLHHQSRHATHARLCPPSHALSRCSSVSRLACCCAIRRSSWISQKGLDFFSRRLPLERGGDAMLMGGTRGGVDGGASSAGLEASAAAAEPTGVVAADGGAVDGPATPALCTTADAVVESPVGPVTES